MRRIRSITILVFLLFLLSSLATPVLAISYPTTHTNDEELRH